MLGESRAAFVAAGILLLLGLVPALPLVPFWMLAALAASLGWLSRRERRRAAEAQARREAEKPEAPERVEQLLELDDLELEIGFGLIPLVDEASGGDLLHRVTLMRRQIAADLGFVVPAVRIRDNMRLVPEAYVLKMRGEEIGRGELAVGQWLAMGPNATQAGLKGVTVREPVFGLPAVWIPGDQRAAAEAAGLTVVEPAAIVATHLTELVRRHASALLTRQDVQTLLDSVKATHPALVEELIPNLLTLSGVQQVLKRLLREQVSIRDMVTILETLADTVPAVKDLDVLVERTREALARSLIRPYKGPQGELAVVTLDPKLEQSLLEAIVPGQEGEQRMVLDPVRAQSLVDGVSEAIQRALAVAQHPILLCSQYLRPHLRDFVARFIPQAVVLSYPEVTGAASVQTVATVRQEAAAA
jgi:flagellar biosynthesis protein FlhA